ncbi:MAG: hypothetical protein EKK37_12970 [Sphingobacteriales bacterium]|nr:MAG: hypothetical protein EKK37_12970 [Sphingobacteriales bacterium]
MRPFVYLISGILLCLTASAQKSKDIPSFGNVDKSELQLTECAFDKNADALVLFDLEETFCSISSSSFFAQTERHARIKILNQSGLKYADIHIPYWLPNENIKNFTAQTYNIDLSGKIITSKVDKKFVYSKRLNKRKAELVFSCVAGIAGDINTVNIKMVLEFKKPVYSVSNYPEFHEFYKQLFTFLNEQIVIKKNLNSD